VRACKQKKGNGKKTNIPRGNTQPSPTGQRRKNPHRTARGETTGDASDPLAGVGGTKEDTTATVPSSRGVAKRKENCKRGTSQQDRQARSVGITEAGTRGKEESSDVAEGTPNAQKWESKGGAKGSRRWKNAGGRAIRLIVAPANKLSHDNQSGVRGERGGNKACSKTWLRRY